MLPTATHVWYVRWQRRWAAPIARIDTSHPWLWSSTLFTPRRDLCALIHTAHAYPAPCPGVAVHCAALSCGILLLRPDTAAGNLPTCEYPTQRQRGDSLNLVPALHGPPLPNTKSHAFVFQRRVLAVRFYPEYTGARTRSVK